MHKVLPWLAGLMIFTLSMVLAVMERQNFALEREGELMEAAQRIEQGIENHIAVLYYLRGLFVSSETVTRDEFKNFLTSLDVDYNAHGAQGIGFAIAVPPGDTQVAKDMVERNYGKSIEPWPATDQDIRFPIVMLEPDDQRNRAALNYDMYSEPVRRKAMQSAWNENRIAISDPVTLVQEIDQKKQKGLLIYLPFYRDKTGKKKGLNAFSDNIKPPIDGFVYQAIRVVDFFKTIVSDFGKTTPRVELYIDTISAENLLYANTKSLDQSYVHEVNLGGHKWILRLGDANVDGYNATGSFATYTILAGGLILSLITGSLMSANIRHVEQIERYSKEIQIREQEKDVLLKEMAHRMKNGIARISSIASLSARKATNIDDYVKTFTERLQAMAKAQDLLSRTTGMTATISELVSLELQQAVTDTTQSISASGPTVQIDSTQSQALGLIIHELMTNAAKYGALADNGALDVRWKTVTNTGGENVQFSWRETGLKSAPDLTDAGFGTQLLNLMVQGQLNGQITRETGPNEFKVDISFPLPELKT